MNGARRLISSPFALIGERICALSARHRGARNSTHAAARLRRPRSSAAVSQGGGSSFSQTLKTMEVGPHTPQEHFKRLRKAWEDNADAELRRTVDGSHSTYTVGDVPGVVGRQRRVATAYDVAVIVSGFVVAMDVGMDITKWAQSETQLYHWPRRLKSVLFKLLPMAVVALAVFDDQASVRTKLINSMWPPAFQTGDGVQISTFLDRHVTHNGRYSWKQVLACLALASGVLAGWKMQKAVAVDRGDDQKKLAAKKWAKTHYIEYANDGSGDYASYNQWSRSDGQ